MNLVINLMKFRVVFMVWELILFGWNKLFNILKNVVISCVRICSKLLKFVVRVRISSV